MAHGSNTCILRSDFVVDLLVVESRQTGSNVVSLAHFEVFTEVLITAPPVSVDHSKTLVAANLMEVRITNVILFAINWEATVFSSKLVFVVGLTNPVAEVFNQLFFLVLNHNIK